MINNLINLIKNCDIVQTEKSILSETFGKFYFKILYRLKKYF